MQGPRRFRFFSIFVFCFVSVISVDAGQRVYYEPPPDPLLPAVQAATTRINAGGSERAEGIAELEKLLKDNPRQRQAKEVLAEAYLQEEAGADAERMLKWCIDDHSDSYRCRTLMGRMLLDKGDIAAAEQQLQKAVQIHAVDPEAQLYLGVARLRREKLDLAEVSLNHALAYRKRGTLGSVFLYLAGVYDKLKKPFRAAQTLEWYLRENPAVPNAAQVRRRIMEFKTSAQAASVQPTP